jgi:CMP-N-acetylneuraminic acid synthetase
MINSKKNTAFIFARGDSKGLVKKNIKLFNGKPLISYAISIALESKLYNHVIVSTDSEEIAEISEAFGAEIPFMRPKELALDDSPELLSWKHAINSFEQEFGYKLTSFSSIPCTSPLRKKIDLINISNMYIENKFDLVLGIVETNHSPQFNMVYKGKDNLMKIMMPSRTSVTRRQDSKKCYNITTIGYTGSPEYIMNADNIFDGQIGCCLIPKKRSIDIDDQNDFDIAEFLYNKREQ